ncbi:unnamed protein product [Rotaria sp. Silwood2]|nr:unnamed protein product [Rotaria sp. Silwood2]CAF3901804.1 unnamed protein product [Rotaria sp. Silwood2]
MMFHGIYTQMIGPKPTTTPTPTPTCPSIDEITSSMEKLFDVQTKILLAKLADMEARLNDLTSCKPMAPSELFMGIYENLTIFDDWILLYNKPYNHNTTSKELKDIANKCNSNRVVVGAIQNEDLSILNVAAVGPTRVLYLNTTVETPEEIENVQWHLESGRSFGFRPIENDPDESPRSELFLSWTIDANYGGWRAGKTTNLYQNSIWHKVIYCMPTF